jgi:hypothetical protein
VEERMHTDDLFRWIADWMVANDLECGVEGSAILNEIFKHIGEDE